MTATLLTSPAELEEFLNDGDKVQAEAEAGTLQATLKNAAALIQAKDASINQQRDIEIQRGVAEFLKDHQIDDKAHPNVPLDLTPVNGGRGGWGGDRVEIVNNGQRLMVDRPANADSVGSKANGIFKNAGELFQAISSDYHKYPDRVNLTAKRNQLAEIMNSAGSLVPADGGFLIPDDFRDQLLMLMLENAVIRPRATVFPMSSLRLPIPAVDETTHSGSIRGGMQFFWGEEAAALTETQASFQRIVLEAKKLYGYSGVPNELIADAPAFTKFLNRAFPEGITWFEDIGFMSGTGVGEPLGWLKGGAVVNYDAAVSSQCAWTDVVGMFARMLPSSLGSAVWLASPAMFPQLANMTFGSGSFPALFTVGGGGGSMGLNLLGRPLIISEKVPNLGTDGALSFVDLSYYLIGDRQVMQADTSDQYLFGSDKTAFRIIERVDGRPWITTAVTPQNGGSTLSPFVTLSGVHT